MIVVFKQTNWVGCDKVKYIFLIAAILQQQNDQHDQWLHD
jgi:hypothetical protein